MKALVISSATAIVAPALLKTLAVLSDATVRRSAVDQEDLKPYLKSAKRPHKMEINRMVVFSHRPLPNILKYRDHKLDLSTVSKTRFLQTHAEEFS